MRDLDGDLAYSVSVTTRAPRPGEIDGVHYRFVDRAAFEGMRQRGELLETREYASNWYGTPAAFVKESVESGRDLVMKPEVNGALAIKAMFPQAVLVFLTAPSADALRTRLEGRSTEGGEAIAQRLAIAQQEAQAQSDFDYLIVNVRVARAAEELHCILAAERLKVGRIRRTEGPS